MNIRLQTWFPYNIQICLNGREWLRRGLEKEGIDFHVHGNKFLHIADYQKAQQLLEQFDTWLSEHEIEAGEQESDQGHYVSLGIYYYESSKHEETAS